jgi:hypothetical protein
VLGARVSQIREVDTVKQRLARAEQDWRDGDIQFIDQSFPKVLPDCRRSSTDSDILAVGGIAGSFKCDANPVGDEMDFAEWDQAFPANRMLASATLDRLRHNAYCLVLEGESFRAPRLAPGTSRGKVASGAKNLRA